MRLICQNSISPFLAFFFEISSEQRFRSRFRIWQIRHVGNLEVENCRCALARVARKPNFAWIWHVSVLELARIILFAVEPELCMIREDINLRVVDHPYLHQLWNIMPLAVGEGAENLSSELEVFADVRHVPRKAFAVCLSPLVFLHGAKDTNQFVRAFLDVKVVLD